MTNNTISTPSGPVTIGSPVQYINEKAHVFAATILAWIVAGDQTTVTVRVWEPSGANYVVTGLTLSKADVVNEPNTWRPLPLPPVSVAEFPVALFVDTVKPLIEVAASDAAKFAVAAEFDARQPVKNAPEGAL